LEARPGGEFLIAMYEAYRMQIPVVLADRRISITRRQLAKISTWDLFHLLYDYRHFSKICPVELRHKILHGHLYYPLPASEKEHLQNLIEKVDPNSMAKYPSVQKALVYDRNLYIASQLQKITCKTVVGVFGEAHIEGIAENLNIHHDDLKDFSGDVSEGSEHMDWMRLLLPFCGVGVGVYGGIWGVHRLLSKYGRWGRFVLPVVLGIGGWHAVGTIMELKELLQEDRYCDRPNAPEKKELL